MFNSLRWRLQVWHAVVLLVILSSFGAIVHRLYWQTRLQQVDADLNRAVTVVMSQVRKLIPRPPFRRNRTREEDGDTVPTNPSTAEPSQSPLTDNPAEPISAQTPENVANNRERPVLDPSPLSPEFQQLFHSDEDSRYYFIIWNNKGEVALKSATAPDVPFPNLQVGSDGLPKRVIRERLADQVYREVVHAGNFREVKNLLIGRSLERDLFAHYQSGWLLFATGVVILAAGTLGGGWLSARAIRPIADMTAAAESISAQNLSARINVKETDSELGNLAHVLNRTFDRLQSAFERQRQFTADASHELRTPLSSISANAELALSRPRSGEEYRAALETCLRSSQRMKSLIDALLVLARFETDSTSMNQDHFSLDSLIRECVEMVTQLAKKRQIQIDCDLVPCEIDGDWDRLAQVVTNLLTNAIKYNVDGGQISIQLKSNKTEAIISVTDSGIGIGPEDLPHIFDRFYQVDKVRSRAEGSCGLGLAICKSIVDAHFGTMTASSELNEGTTIEVRLPLMDRISVLEKPMSSAELLVYVRTDED